MDDVEFGVFVDADLFDFANPSEGEYLDTDASLLVLTDDEFIVKAVDGFAADEVEYVQRLVERCDMDYDDDEVLLVKPLLSLEFDETSQLHTVESELLTSDIVDTMIIALGA